MRFAPLVLALACALSLFVGIGRVGYLDVHEARDARVAAEQHASPDPLTPHYEQRPFFDRPLLGYLAELVTHRDGPPDPIPSRLLRAVLATALVLLTWRTGALHFGERAGVAAGLVLASCLGLPMAARADGAQVLASLAGWMAFSIFAREVFSERRAGFTPLALGHLSLGMALLTGGLLPALWPIGGVALYARLAGRREALKAIHPLAAFAIAVGFALPWYAPVAMRHGLAFAAHVLWMPYGEGAIGPWYAGVVLTVSFLVVGGFPWSALLPAAFAHAAMRWRAVRFAVRVGQRPESPFTPKDLEILAREEREERIAHLMIAGLVAALVPIAIYPSPPTSAALPALPAVALLCGRFVDHLFEDQARLSGTFARATLMLALTGTVTAIALSMAGSSINALFPALRWLAPFVLVSGWAPFLVHFFLRRSRWAAALIAVPVLLGSPLVAWRLLPELEDFLSARTVAEAMNIGSPADATLALLESPPATLRLYLERHTTMVEKPEQALTSVVSPDRHVYLAFRPARERETARRLATPLEILARSPSLVLARVSADTSGAR
jgi:4-amino-4-deoxy-L-arabinose transferase-like glycosyltransferase